MSISNERPPGGGGTPPPSYLRSSSFNRCISIVVTVILMCVGLLILFLGSGCLTHPEKQFQITEASANTYLTSPICQVAAGVSMEVGVSMIVFGGWWFLERSTARVVRHVRRRFFQNRDSSSGRHRDVTSLLSSILRRILPQKILGLAAIMYGRLLVHYASRCLFGQNQTHRSIVTESDVWNFLVANLTAPFSPLSNDTVMHVNGTLQYRNGTVQFPNGTRILRNGTTQEPSCTGSGSSAIYTYIDGTTRTGPFSNTSDLDIENPLGTYRLGQAYIKWQEVPGKWPERLEYVGNKSIQWTSNDTWVHKPNLTQTHPNETAIPFFESSCRGVSVLDVLIGIALIVAGFVFGILMRRQIFLPRRTPTATIEELPEEIPLTDLPPSTDVTEPQGSNELPEENGGDDPDMPPLEE